MAFKEMKTTRMKQAAGLISVTTDYINFFSDKPDSEYVKVFYDEEAVALKFESADEETGYPVKQYQTYWIIRARGLTRRGTLPIGYYKKQEDGTYKYHMPLRGRNGVK